MSARVAVLASGRGTNLQALIDYSASLGVNSSANIVVVASNRPDAPALERARNAGIATETFTASDDGDALLELLRRHAVDLVVLAGYMKKIPQKVVAGYGGRIINVHPGLLPEFGGQGMYGARVHEAVIRSGVKCSGVTVHLVDDEFDHGPVVAQWRVPVMESDTVESLAERVLAAEHIVYPRVVEMIASLRDSKIFADF
jgi:formyltetrahydrofolate-dependent phosphoribosylglycinamide formyltransferase